MDTTIKVLGFSLKVLFWITFGILIIFYKIATSSTNY